MANLGSNDTPVEGDDFSLPAGAQLDEESGDLVIRDSGGSVVFRRDEAAGEWVSDSLNVDNATISGNVTLSDSIYDVESLDAGETHTLGSFGGGVELLYQKTEAVSTTATEILAAGGSQFEATVHLRGVNDTGDIAVDSLLGHFGGQDVIGSYESGTPANRTYSTSLTDIDLSVGSGSYDVVVYAWMVSL